MNSGPPLNLFFLPCTMCHPEYVGARNCIGRKFAMNEMLLVLAALVFHFNWGVVEPSAVEPESLIVLRAANGMPVVATERHLQAAGGAAGARHDHDRHHHLYHKEAFGSSARTGRTRGGAKSVWMGEKDD